MLLSDPKLFNLMKLICLKAIDWEQHVYTRHSAYYTWMIYGWGPLNSDLPSYDSSHFSKPMQLSCWVHKTFRRQKYLTKDLYFVKEKFS